ncbi:hypothetical protein [Streptomyces sp. SID3343]|uniref:hypothetical protein n=1 Tax=Streptomyces sp. SID3343 TaxID=2690260 RepID=UPI001368DA54|nr:hypothetical protein [Streptomyces sp. SID3343]MYW06346.1 hypothetical protein [Streptomyces sp. SID3343]
MVRVPAAGVAAVGLVGGYAVARYTKKRALGGAVLAAAGAVAAREWQAKAGTPTAAALVGLYTVGFGASHPLAKKIGAWPSVFTVAGTVAAASYALAERKG